MSDCLVIVTFSWFGDFVPKIENRSRCLPLRQKHHLNPLELNT